MNNKKNAQTTLMVRLDSECKASVVAAAELRGATVSDYVRTVMLAQAQKDLAAANDRTILLSAQDQLAFWEALQAPVELTPAQRELGRMMQGKS
jgi:uncharacterized protein (DUF1778 family)